MAMSGGISIAEDGADQADRLADGEWEARKVKLGLSDASWTQVKEGVVVGETVSLIRPVLSN
jgi:hypothetical protein